VFGGLAEDASMGAWGPGNFENDCSADYLHEICEPILKQIREAMSNPSLIQADEPDADLITAGLEIIACLSEHLGRFARGQIQDFVYPRVLPAPDEVAQWRQKFLATWDATIDGLQPAADYKKRRRDVIIETFDRVEQLARRK
jgi:hypothetical protein